MECIAEMIYIWPVSNPFVVFVQHFVDEDLGYFVGFAYWWVDNMHYMQNLANQLRTGTHMAWGWKPSSLL